jgi:acetyl esterase/lipase
MVNFEKYDIHEDFKIKTSINLNGFMLRFGPILPKAVSYFSKREKGLKARKERIKSFDGEMVPIVILQPKGIFQNAPCILYFHGGAFILGSSPYNANSVLRLAKSTHAKIIFVDYRLAGKYSFPTGVEDCYAALTWTYQNAERLGINKNKIAVYGESAGGALAAAVTQMARDRKGPPICLQMLIYPVTDCTLSTESARKFTDTPVWNAGNNAKMWEVYLRDSTKPYSPYASPLAAETLKTLPSAYVETTEFDPLRDEGVAYANRLIEDGVDTELFETKRTVHGFDILVYNNEIIEESLRRRGNALNKAFVNTTP